MPRFGRVFSLIIGTTTGGDARGIEIKDNLRLTFDVQKDDTKNPNRSTIRIWNLAESNRKLLEKPDVRCVFKAGYAEENGPLEVYQGDVAFAFSRHERADNVTEIELGEGYKAIRDVVAALSYDSGVTSTRVLRDLAQKLHMSINIPSDAPVRSWQNGLAFHGSARQALDKICVATGLSWSVQHGALQVIRSGGNTNRTVFDLAADSGLIGSPERVRKGKQEVSLDPSDERALRARTRQISSTTQEEDGWRVRSLLLPTLVPGDRVKLSSKTVEGIFTIRSLRHFGDSHGGDWITELKIIDPTKSPTDTRAQAPLPLTRVRVSNPGGGS